MKTTTKIIRATNILLFFILTLSTTLNANASVISEFSTKFNENNLPRVENLKLASIAIDNVILKPGEVFSYNAHLGPTTKDRGFEKAKIIVNGEEKEGYGGGVCQISSTLYNAAKNAGLEIIERHPHSKKVSYIEKGKDAATSYGVIDLKFKNTFYHPIRIDSYIDGNTVYVQILKTF